MRSCVKKSLSGVVVPGVAGQEPCALGDPKPLITSRYRTPPLVNSWSEIDASKVTWSSHGVRLGAPGIAHGRVLDVSHSVYLKLRVGVVSNPASRMLRSPAKCEATTVTGLL